MAMTSCFRLSLAALALQLAGPSGLAAADLAELRTRGSLRVLVDAEEEPTFFSQLPSGPPGFERELVESFAKDQNLRVEVVTITPWETIIPSLVAGRGDLITGLIDLPERRKLVDFTKEILPIRHVVVTRSAAIQNVKVLRAAKLGVIRGSSWANAALAEGVPAANLLYADTTAALLAALKKGQIVGIVMSAIDYEVVRAADPSLQAGMFVGPATSLCWGVRKEDVALRLALDLHMESLKRSGTWTWLVRKYFRDEFLALLARMRSR